MNGGKRVRRLGSSVPTAFMLLFRLGGANADEGSIPFKSDGLGADVSSTRVFVALAICFAVLMVVAFVMRRRNAAWLGRGEARSPIRIVQRTSLGPKATLWLVELDDQRYFLAQTESQIRRLATLDTPRTDSSVSRT